MQAWLAGSLVRHYPTSPAKRRSTLTLHAARGQAVAFQVAFRTEGDPDKLTARVDAPDGVGVQVRRVGFVPMPHFNAGTPLEERDGIGRIPGLVPDPLFPESMIHAGPHETNAFWLTVRVPLDARPGRYPITVTLSGEKTEPVTLTAAVVVHRAVMSPRRDFPVTHWFYADALCDWYKLEPFEEAFWPLLEAYFDDLAAHCQDVTHVPIFTPPTDGVKRPNQLLGVRRQGDRYAFDWALVRRWVAAARAHGMTWFEWAHFFTQWGARYAIRVYEGGGNSEKLLWDPETLAVSPTYRDFLGQFLPEFKRFLDEEGLTGSSFFHLSDEPHGEADLASYRAARGMLREIAPWMRVMDALSDIEFAREGLTDIPVPITNRVMDFLGEGYACWVYFCCGPRGRYVQRLLDTPLVKTRMLGWIFYRTKVRGFLHWGYNYWHKSQTRELINPYCTTDGMRWPGWSYGDTFVVYPGESGPVDSIRWEVFAEGLQDYALLQTAGVDPDDAALSAIVDYADFPRDEAWIAARRREVLMKMDRRG